MKIPNIRLQNQQLLNPLFCQPKELVSWLGAMQAQNYSMVKCPDSPSTEETRFSHQ